jgi:outer membrane protein assembly factor BamD
MLRTRFSIAATALALLLTGCGGQGFRPATFPTLESLFEASQQQLERRRWDNAVSGFERLTLMLPARHELLPASHFYLGQAYGGRGEHLLAAQAYLRVPELFPNDTLAGESLFRAGQSYAALWRRPDLDAQYGEVAIGAFGSLIENYPDSPHRAVAEQEIARLRQQLATKLYDTGVFYFRRRGFDPAIIYFNAVVEEYPETRRARDALLRLVESYRRINYQEEVRETCEVLHREYPGDAEVRSTCGPAPAAAAEQTAPTPGAR